RPPPALWSSVEALDDRAGDDRAAAHREQRPDQLEVAPERCVVRADPFDLVEREHATAPDLAHPPAKEPLGAGKVRQHEPGVDEVRRARRARRGTLDEVEPRETRTG